MPPHLKAKGSHFSLYYHINLRYSKPVVSIMALPCTCLKTLTKLFHWYCALARPTENCDHSLQRYAQACSHTYAFYKNWWLNSAAKFITSLEPTCYSRMKNVSPSLLLRLYARPSVDTFNPKCRTQLPTNLALVQSLYSVSKSFLEMSLQRFTPGWMAPSPLRMRTCSTLHTTGVISSLFSLV